MKITIEQEGKEVSVSDDSLVIDDVIQLFRDALLALGYAEQSINQYIESI